MGAIGEMLVTLSMTLVLTLSAPLPFDKPRSPLLPLSLNPEHYEISLDPRLDLGLFRGVVVITGAAVVETDHVVVHCRGLTLNTSALSLTDMTSGDELKVKAKGVQEDVTLQQCRLPLARSLVVGHEYRLTAEFTGVIGREGYGLYSDHYYELGVKHDLLVTHLQPNHARAVFPCFDEPHYKAQFILKVATHQFPTALSNMPLAPPTPELGGWAQFEETPPMSSYLLALVLCDYQALKDGDDPRTAVWAPRGRLHEAQLALNTSIAVLDQCERYFGRAHVLPKLDHVPVPTLNNIAMENWGVITYKRDFLLWEEGVSTWAQREMISQVICHETVHQWLGNLVTTSWWNTTWLNEGVTSFFHYYIMDQVDPHLNGMDNGFVSQIQLILAEETSDSRPLTNNEPLAQDSITTMAFNPSTYLKGAAITRMVFYMMTPDVFRETMEQYITENEFSVVDEDDLWQSFSVVADLPVDLSSVMYSWTHQPGYPLVAVHRDPNGCISVTQEKYLSSDESDVRWTIPLTYTTSAESDFSALNVSLNTVWFHEDKDELRLDECLEPTDWIVFNIRQAGFYRVLYDAVTWRSLAHDLRNCDLSDVHPVNRALLLYDGFHLAAQGLMELPRVLELARYLAREREFLPWTAALQWLSTIRAHVYTTEAFDAFKRFAVSLVGPAFGDLPLSGDAGGSLAEAHRRQLVEFACLLEHPRCLAEATNTAYLHMSGVNVRTPQDLRGPLLCAAVRHGQEEVWNFALKSYLSSAENQRASYLMALACTSKPETLRRLLRDLADPSSFIRSSEDRLALLMEVGKQDQVLELILDMMIDRFHILIQAFDFEVLLNLLKLFLRPTLSLQEKEKVAFLAELVIKSQPQKQIDIMNSIISEVQKSSLTTEQLSALIRWLTEEYPGEEQDKERTKKKVFDDSSDQNTTDKENKCQPDESFEVDASSSKMICVKLSSSCTIHPSIFLSVVLLFPYVIR